MFFDCSYKQACANAPLVCILSLNLYLNGSSVCLCAHLHTCLHICAYVHNKYVWCVFVHIKIMYVYIWKHVDEHIHIN